ncbi:hypothetical protein OOU_Y34scaffold00635g1 [Pyricularia oryzae Y34]|uniref:Uncharacterized protein n=3 Tax=Pyricularia oryzae TaxID=318829 RepID=A0A4P7N1E1_PYROR|nr:hypothetical protein OOU_Y34scaffold00635g1 [Pyricularia oryzae Y34]QBZ56109.1 hypothetical protein PoMZ_01015 [Pyricularia oryzae]
MYFDLSGGQPMSDAVRCDLELHADLKDLTQPVFIQAGD